MPPYAVRRRSSKDLLLTVGCTRLLGSSSVCFGPLIEDLYSGGKRPHGGGGALLWRRGSLEWFIGVANQPTSNKEHPIPVLTCLTEGQLVRLYVIMDLKATTVIAPSTQYPI